MPTFGWQIPAPIDYGPSRFPRIVRWGMSYGPMHTPGKDDDHEDRGLLFMAYSSDISEQFEVIQRWLTGGKQHRFEHQGKAARCLVCQKTAFRAIFVLSTRQIRMTTTTIRYTSSEFNWKKTRLL